MTGARTHAEIGRAVAIIAVKEAKTAQLLADKSPSETHIRGAYRASVFAKRSLLKASEDNPDDEVAMIDLALLFGEQALSLLARLVHMGEPQAT